MQSTGRFAGQSDFAMFLRTGLRFRHQLGADVEVKFNPWHDPEDGRFTFANQGNYFGNGGGRGGGGGGGDASPASGSYQARVRADEEHIRRRNARLSPKHPSNYSVYKVRSGDTLSRIAAARTGLTASDLAWLNDLKPDARLHIGQSLKLPHQSSLDAGRDALGVAVGLANYADRHGGRMPSGPGSITGQLAEDRLPAVLLNGYRFQQDGLIRTRLSEGELASEKSRASKRSQRTAGGADRRRGDDGGHYIARRFNGPSESVNLFAQDRNFNRGAYRALEDELAAYQRQGKRVYVKIIPSYRGTSQRPYRIVYSWQIDGKWKSRRFFNEKEGRAHD